MIGVIADDLTGAAELGAAGFRHGLDAEIWLDTESIAPADLICVDSDSRSCAPVQAGQRAARAARALKALGVSWIYKKVDSAMRGPIAAELECLMRELSLPRTLLVPANPSKDRVIRRGHYFIQNIPIHKTDFRFDPEYPCRFSSVRKLLGSDANCEIHVRKVGQPLPTRGIIVGQAENPRDLEHWASRCDASTIASGAVEFFRALLEREGLKPAMTMPSATGRQAWRELFVAGSASATTLQFVEESRSRGVPVITLPKELTSGRRLTEAACRNLSMSIQEAFQSNSRVVVAVGLPMVKNRRIARHFSMDLARVAAETLESARINEIFAEGGATAAHLARSMGWHRLRVHREIAPGIVTVRAVSARRLLTIKPGSYPWPDELRSHTS